MVAWLRTWWCGEPLKVLMSFDDKIGPLGAILEKRPSVGVWLGCSMEQCGNVLRLGHTRVVSRLLFMNRSVWWLMRRMKTLSVGVEVTAPRDSHVGSVVLTLRWKKRQWWRTTVEQYRLEVPFDKLERRKDSRRSRTLYMPGTMTRDKRVSDQEARYG